MSKPLNGAEEEGEEEGGEEEGGGAEGGEDEVEYVENGSSLLLGNLSADLLSGKGPLRAPRVGGGKSFGHLRNWETVAAAPASWGRKVESRHLAVLS